jgi:proteasome lid subunit RPN8/RPN11
MNIRPAPEELSMISIAPPPKTGLGPFIYRIEYFVSQDGVLHPGGPIHDEILVLGDFCRAVETASFDALKRGVIAEYDPRPGEVLIEPRFSESPNGAASPRTIGFDVVLSLSDGSFHRVSFDSSYLRHRARRFGAELARSGQLSEDFGLYYQLAACPIDPELARHDAPRAMTATAFTIEPASAAIAIADQPRSNLGSVEPWDDPRAEDLPVLLNRRLIDDAVLEARAHPDQEVGGILLGRLNRDPEDGSVYLHITGLVPAESTEATVTSVTFTPETFAQAREVIDLRGEGEIVVGWMHSHPFCFCAECPVPAPQECIRKILFYSRDDEFLMELAFSRPFMVGLLAAIEPRLEPALGHPGVRLYGWNHGEIQARGFPVLID